MTITLLDHPYTSRCLRPLTFTRPVGAIRVGILTIAEKWARFTGHKVVYETETPLREKYHAGGDAAYSGGSHLLINGGLCPEAEVWAAIEALAPGDGYFKGDHVLAMNFHPEMAGTLPEGEAQTMGHLREYSGEVTFIARPWDIFRNNASQIRFDYDLITAGRQSAPLTDPHTRVYGNDLFIEEGAQVRAATINTENGPVYLGKNSVVHEGALIRGALALCEGAHVNMGAKLRGDSTIGPYSKVGGELSNSVILGYSNKAHDGFVGNSVIGEWCNLGADTNTSNLKNNYSPVRAYSYQEKDFIDTGLQFCGLVMGDHSKSGINTMFNTGTVVGVSANIYGGGFPDKFIPSFAWGGAQEGFMTFRFEKAEEVAKIVTARRKVPYTDADHEILKTIYRETVLNRYWEQSYE